MTTPIDKAAESLLPWWGLRGQQGLLEAQARAVFASIDADELARAMDPEAFEDHPIEARRPLAALQWAARRKIALDHAEAAKAHLQGST
ncbi:hypothetical protein ACFWGN_16230 [Oerskovia sp. NPDC060338]|uniref:hypothetical protein n=1 Tax=Oerskovia sp. NPDC060338 TaxID=3347100 RepID=UPI00364953F2